MLHGGAAVDDAEFGNRLDDDRTHPHHGLHSDGDLFAHRGTGADPAAHSDLYVAGETGAWAEVHTIAHHAIVFNNRTRVDDGQPAHASPGIDSRQRAHKA